MTDLDAAYAAEAELTRRRRASGHASTGWKVGYANKAVWRALKLETVAWARMYDDTVRYAGGNRASLSIAAMTSAKIEPEIVFALKRAPEPGLTDPAAILDAVAWLALGFEIVDCPFADWTFQPAEFVAAGGLHAALIIGDRLPVDASNVTALAEALPTFTVTLSVDGQTAAEGSGKNVLRSPALCLGELASAMARRAGTEPLAAGELVSSGSLTESQLIAPGQTWTATVAGLGLPALSLHVAA
jgi:2-oxo-3-hexenedioate decarboxylase